MNKFFTSVFVLLALSTSVVSAQSAYQIYISDSTTEASEYSVGSVVSGQFNLSNTSQIPQSDLYYVVESGIYDEENLQVLELRGKSEKIGPFYLKSEAQVTLPFKYTLPDSLTGSSALLITAYLQDGTLVAQSQVPLTIKGRALSPTVTLFDSVLYISDFDQALDPQTGPTVYEGETLTLEYALSSSEDLELTPVLRVYDRVDSPDALVRTVQYDSFQIGSTLVDKSIEIPTDLAPLVYFAVLSFEDEEGKAHSTLPFRYIVGGSIATVRNITTDTLEVKKGQEFEITVAYGGQPLDEYRPEKQIKSTGQVLTVTATNENGEHVAKVSQNIDIEAENKEVKINLTAQTSAQSLTFSSQIQDKDGNILDEYTTSLPSEETLNNQKSLAEQSIFTKNFLYGSLIIIVLAFLMYALWRKGYLFKIPTVAVLGFLLLAAIFGPSYVKAGITLDGQYYLDSIPEDLIGGWKVIQSYRTKYDDITETGDTRNIYYDNFQITSVSSPLPPKLKIYEPGERFTLSINAVYGDCNNEARMYRAFAYKTDSEWWKMTPKIDGTIEERVASWGNLSLLNINNTTNWKSLFLATDLSSILAISDDREKALKDIVRQSEVTYDRNGLTAKLFTFDNGKATTAQFINWANANKNKAESAKNTFNSLTNYLKSSPEIANFDYTQTTGFSNPQGAFTTTYIDRMRELNDKVYEYTKPQMADFLTWFSASKHATEITPTTLNRVYTAPSTPGFHKIHFYLYQAGNSGKRDITAVQTICVRGAGVCPNEKKPIELTCAPNATPTHAGTDVTFTSTLSNAIGAVKYSWKVGGKEVSTSPLYTIDKSVVGTVAPTLTITDSATPARSKTATCSQVVVRESLGLSCAINGNVVNTNVTNKIGANPLSYIWKIDGVPTKNTSATSPITWTQNKANVTVRDTVTGATASTVCSRGAVTALSCSASPSPVYPERNTVVTPVIEGGTGPFTYRWSGSATPELGTTKLLTYNWTRPGTKIVTFEVTDSTGKKDSESCSVEVGCGAKTPEQIENEGKCIGGLSTIYVCTSNGWVGQQTSCNVGPGQPTISGPITGNVDTEYSFTIKSVDPNGDTLNFALDWDGNGTVDEWTPIVASNVNHTIRRAWDTVGGKTFKVAAKDSKGAVSAWTSHTITLAPVEELACSISPTPGVVNEEVTYSATEVTGAQYKWYVGKTVTGNPITNWTSYSHSFTPTTTGLYNRTVQMTVGGTVKTKMCQTLTVGCGTKPSTGETTCSNGDKEKEWICRDTGWELERVSSCGGGDDGGGGSPGGGDPNNPPATEAKDPKRLTFRFTPDTISEAGGTCPLDIEVIDATSCQIKNRLGNPVGTYSAVAGRVYQNDLPFGVGTYRLECTGTGARSTTFMHLDTKSCYSNPDIQER